MTRLAQTGDGLEPAEDLLDPFALVLTYAQPGWRVGRASIMLVVLRAMWGVT
jgi:hypothetical protein